MESGGREGGRVLGRMADGGDDGSVGYLRGMAIEAAGRAGEEGCAAVREERLWRLCGRARQGAEGRAVLHGRSSLA